MASFPRKSRYGVPVSMYRRPSPSRILPRTITAYNDSDIRKTLIHFSFLNMPLAPNISLAESQQHNEKTGLRADLSITIDLISW